MARRGWARQDKAFSGLTRAVGATAAAALLYRCPVCEMSRMSRLSDKPAAIRQRRRCERLRLAKERPPDVRCQCHARHAVPCHACHAR